MAKGNGLGLVIVGGALALGLLGVAAAVGRPSPPDVDPLLGSGLVLPLDGVVRPLAFRPMSFTSTYGWRVLNGQRQFHPGIDLVAPVGTPVVCPEPGVVIAVTVANDANRKANPNGNSVAVRGQSGIVWALLHLSIFDPRLERGAQLAAGGTIGRTGDTGDVTGPHLHLQTTFRGKTFDPTKCFPPGSFRAFGVV